MKNILKSVGAVCAMLCMAQTAYSADLDVVFEQTPLFKDTNIAPGHEVSRTVTVTNNGTSTESVYMSVQNESSNGLAEVMGLGVTSDAGSTEYFNNSFFDFFAEAPVDLGILNQGESRVYTFTASLDGSIGNAYQDKTFSFDLVMGFEDGETVTDTDDDDDTPGGGGGSSGSGTTLTIFNENVEYVNNTIGSAGLSWNTNQNATTYLVCGRTANGPFTLSNDANDFFGYEFDIAENTTLKQSHSVVVNSLNLGEYQCVPLARNNTVGEFTSGDVLSFIVVPVSDTFGDVAGAGANTFLALEGGVAGVDGAPADAGADTDAEDALVDGAGTSGPEIEDGLLANLANLDLSFLNFENADCIFIVLLLLVALSLSWSVIEDLGRHRDLFKRIFFKNFMYSAIFLILLGLAYIFEYLESTWWLFLIAWIVMVVADYRMHAYSRIVQSPVARHMYYTLVSALYTIIALVTAWVCVWWPFAGVCIVSLGALIYQKIFPSKPLI